MTDRQLATVTEAAALLPPLRSVAALLVDTSRPTDTEAIRALRQVLSERGVVQEAAC